MVLVLACGALAQVLPEPAPGADPPCVDCEPGSVSAFEQQLLEARGLLAQGDLEGALVLLLDLRDRVDAGETPPADIARDALVYLGDAQYLRGEKDAARDSFRRVLQADPAHAISPYHHTEDVRAFFALVRDAVERERLGQPPPPPDPVPPPPPALPWWGYAPLGVPQLAMGRTTRGVTYALLQGSFAAGSVGTTILFRRVNRDPGGGHPFGWTPAQVERRSTQLKYGVQWPLTVAFYATWAISVVDAGTTWQSDHRPVRVTLQVGPGSLGVAGRF